MMYADGQQVRLGDIVRLGKDQEGVVVCSIDTNEFSSKYPHSLKAVFLSGAVFEFSGYGVVHYPTVSIDEAPEPDLLLISRAR